MSEPARILVTGASRRLGLFLTEQFLEQGCYVFALTRGGSDELQRLGADAERTQGKLSVVQGDYFQTDVVAQMIAELAEKTPWLDAVIHNASVFELDGDEFSYSHYQAMFNIHMALPAQLNMGLLPLLEKSPEVANVVHITDIFAENPNPNYTLYCSTKAAAENMAKGFAKKCAPKVRVNTIQPGPIKFLPSHTQAAKDKVLAETLLRYEGGFMPVFQAIRSILDNPYMTGASIKVDGGRALGRG